METFGPFLEPLTPREVDILRGMVDGLTNVEIAQRLVLSPGTVKWYIKQVYGKLGVHSRNDAVTQAVASGLLKSPSHASQLLDPSNNGCPLINPLPQDVSDRYLGNLEKQAQLDTLLRQPVRFIGIYGRAGSGKTALACKVLGDLCQSAASLPGLRGIVCLTATGTGVSLNRLFVDLGRLLSEGDQAALEVVSRNKDIPLSEKIAILLGKIGKKHIILLLDNLETVQNLETGELIEPGLQEFIAMSLTQSSALLFLVTSREPLSLPRSLKTWEHQLSLEDGLPPEDAVLLLRRFDPSGLAGLRDASFKELSEIAEKLGGFPRALESVVGMLLEDPLLRLADVRLAVSRLDGEISAAFVEQALSHLGSASIQVLQGLAIFGKPVSYAALAFVLKPFFSDAQLHNLLGRLIQACFIKMNRVSRHFSLHPIDQAYCYRHIPPGSSTAADKEPPAFTRLALHARAALYYRGQRLPRPDWHKLADLEPQLDEIQHWVSAANGDEAARVLLEIDRDYLWEWEYKELLRRIYPLLAGLVQDPHLAMHVARRQAWLKFFDGTQESEKEFRRLLDEARRQGFIQEEADALDDLAQIYRRGNRDPRQGIAYHRQALVLYRQIGDRRGEADALGGLGAVYAYIQPEEAVDYFIKAANIQRELGNASSLSFVLSMLGNAYENMGALDQARGYYNEAIQVARQNNSLEALSRAYGQMVALCVLTGENDQIEPLLTEAFAITQEFTGLPVTVQLGFFVGQAALYMALAGDIPGAIALMERIRRETPPIQHQLIPVGNFFLSLILLLGGQFQKARELIPVEAVMSYGSGNGYWIGVLLIKTGELAAAATFFDRILTVLQPAGPAASQSTLQDNSKLHVLALALAGLALLNQSHEMALAAAGLAREMVLDRRNWQADLHRALIRLLIKEPGGQILFPVINVLGSRPD